MTQLLWLVSFTYFFFEALALRIRHSETLRFYQKPDAASLVKDHPWLDGFPVESFNNLPVWMDSFGNEYVFDYGLDVIMQVSEKNLSREMPHPMLHADGSWKHNIVNKAPSQDLIVSKFRTCKITRVQNSSHAYELALHPNTSISVLHVFKNGGGTTVKGVLGEGGQIWSTFNHPPDKHLMSLAKDSTWLHVAFVRDPQERALSAFHEYQKRLNPQAHFSKKKLLQKFEGMVNALHSEPDNFAAIPYGGHFQTQTNFMIDEHGEKLPLDYIGRTDNLENELRYLLQHPKFKAEWHSGPDSIVENKFRVDKNDISPDIQKKLCEIYKDDYCCYGFDFPARCNETC